MSAKTLAGRYQLHRRVGGGGMGTVWEARDTALERPVAVKVLPGTGPRDRAFLREARALSRLHHPNVVRLYDAGTDAGDAYLVLELVRGRTLAAAIDSGSLAPAEVRRIGRELAEALAHAHALGVVHRDLSPGNVLLQEGGRVRLADFGIARLAESTATMGGEVWGTPAYIAPEQAAGERVGPAADVYALGLVLLEALTGERAFSGTPTESSLARLHRDPVVPDWVPGDLSALLIAMTARSPAGRPSAAEVAVGLGSDSPRRPTVPLPTGAVPGSRAAALPVGLAAVPWWRRRTSMAAGLLLASAALLGLALRGQPSNAPEPVATVQASPPAPPAPAPEPAHKPANERARDEGDDDDKDEKPGKGEGRGKGEERED